MKKVLDACCGSRMFYYNRQNKNVLFMDKRENMKPFVPFVETFGNSTLLGPSITDFEDMFRVLQGEPLNDKDTN